MPRSRRFSTVHGSVLALLLGAWFTWCPEQSAAVPNFIFPDSGYEKLFFGDVKGLSAKQLRISRNEIFARHGYPFSSAALR